MTQAAEVYHVPATQEAEIMREASLVLVKADALVVATTKDKEFAVTFTQDVNDKIRRIAEYFKPMKDKAYAAHKEIVTREKEALAIPEEAKRIVLGKISQYDQEQERLRRDEEARLREEARKRFEADLKRAEATIARIAGKTEDIQETIDLLKMEIEGDVSDTERQKIEAQIDVLAARRENNQAKIEDVQQRVSEPVFEEPVIVPRDEKVSGSVSRKEVEMKITNPMAVIKAIAAGTLPVKCCKIVESEIKRFIQMHDGQKAVPGVSFRMVTKTHVRG